LQSRVSSVGPTEKSHRVSFGHPASHGQTHGKKGVRRRGPEKEDVWARQKDLSKENCKR